jgi:hypothetical protein
MSRRRSNNEPPESTPEEPMSNTPPTNAIDLDRAYPILTEEVDIGTAPDGGVSTSRLGHTARNAVAEVLGWRPKSGDGRGFVAALTSGFDLREVEGHIEAVWRPRGFAAQADIGAVTGAQASLYARARADLTQILDLVEGIQPLAPATDADDCNAFRSLVADAVTQLVDELGMPGGPRRGKVDNYFHVLTGWTPNDGERRFDMARIAGQLGRVRDVFGLDADHVNTVDDERILTSYLTLVDLVGGLFNSWVNVRRKFGPDSAGEGFLGTDLVLLSRYLGSVGQSVEELRYTFASVFLGRADQEAVAIPRQGMTLAGLLDWISDFAQHEGIRQIQEGGKDGLETAFTPTARRLQQLVREHLVMVAHDGTAALSLRKIVNHNLPPAMFTTRVQLACVELHNYLRQVALRASRIHRWEPYIAAIEPEVVPSEGAFEFQLYGTGFSQDDRVAFDLGDGRPIEAAITRRGSDTIIGSLPAERVSAIESTARVLLLRDGRRFDGPLVYQVAEPVRDVVFVFNRYDVSAELPVDPPTDDPTDDPHGGSSDQPR